MSDEALKSSARSGVPSWLKVLGGGLVYIFGLFLLLVLTFVALRVPPSVGLQALWTGAFGTPDNRWYAISEMLVKTTPLLLTGLGITVAWRAGLFSIGGEGQLVMGAIAATAIGQTGKHLPGGLLTLLMLTGGMAAGACWSAVAGWLRVRRNVQEVISTIMLNYIALNLLVWLVEGALQEHTHRESRSEPLPDAALFARLLPPALTNGMTTSLHAGVLLALLVVAIIFVLMTFTRAGFALRVIGQNPEAARAARFDVDRMRVLAMAISGGLCGLAGVVELLGSGDGHLSKDFPAGWGYTAIPVALLGGLHPIGTLFSALFFGALKVGSIELEQFHKVPSVMVYVVQAAAVLAIVGARAWRSRRSGAETD